MDDFQNTRQSEDEGNGTHEMNGNPLPKSAELERVFQHLGLIYTKELKAIWRWLETPEDSTCGNREDRTKSALRDFFDHVDFSRIAVEDILVLADSRKLIKHFPQLLDALNYHMLPWRHAVTAVSEKRSDKQEDDVLFIYGGFGNLFEGPIRTHNSIRSFNLQKNTISSQDAVKSRIGHCCAMLNGFLFVAGGCTFDLASESQSISNEVFRYDVLRNCWQVIAPMQENRSYFSLVSLQSKLYAIGGLTSTDGGYNHANQLTDSVEIYDPVHNSWSSGESLPHGLYCHAATTAISEDRIYVMGGIIDPVALPTQSLSNLSRGAVYIKGCSANLCLDLAHSMTWKSRSSLPDGRAGHGVCRLTDGRIVVVGGFGLMGANMVCYSPDDDTWDEWIDSSFPTKIEWLSATSIGDTIYIVGGGDTPPTPESFTPKFGHLFAYSVKNQSEQWNMQLTSWEHRFLPGSQVCATRLPSDLQKVALPQKSPRGK